MIIIKSRVKENFRNGHPFGFKREKTSVSNQVPSTLYFGSDLPSASCFRPITELEKQTSFTPPITLVTRLKIAPQITKQIKVSYSFVLFIPMSCLHLNYVIITHPVLLDTLPAIESFRSKLFYDMNKLHNHTLFLNI